MKNESAGMSEPAGKEPAGKEPSTKSEPSLKVVPAKEKSAGKKKLAQMDRKRLRFTLLVAVPAIALLVGFGLYLMGGRYISTDNAYVGAQKVLITPDISGKISNVLVKEGQHIAAGDALFEIDPVPFKLALEQAQSKLTAAKTDYASLKTNYQSVSRLIDLAAQNVDLKQKDVERKQQLVSNRSGAQADVDTSMAALVAAQNSLEQLKQQQAAFLNQLNGRADLPIEEYAPYASAKAALDQAQRDLDHAVVRAPIDGTATQVDSIQLGRFVSAGTAVFAVVDDSAPWVDANPKETDVTYLRLGQKATIEVDAFPGRTFTGTVTAISPGTGAQFAILPPQNASGNWVKVVQRVPLRVTLDPNSATKLLRAGMSANVSIDTKRSRSLASIFNGAHAATDEPETDDVK